uniref:Uncharacterized protein n=1 Tax=viral metagenome TaxID=1070528 RepID=A0A6C0CXD4_9ZZZZ
MEIQIKKFNMNKITSDKVVVLIGKRNTGKSYLVKDILYHHQNIPVGQAISGTEAANEFYGSIIPKVFIHEEYTAQIIQNIIKRQKLMVEKLKQNPNMDPRVFLILDDCLYDNSWTKNTDIRSIFMNGRHYKILFLLTMQYALGIPPNLRTNIDYVFILRENYVSNRKRLYEHYAGMFPTFDMFCQVMDQCTENYECLVIDNNANSNQLVDQVFWYKAPERPNFKCGAKEFWDYSDKNFQKNTNQSDDITSSRIKNRVEVVKHQ